MLSHRKLERIKKMMVVTGEAMYVLRISLEEDPEKPVSYPYRH
jgi:hypothetical protein